MVKHTQIKEWIEELKILSKIAKSESQAAYSCVVSGFKHNLTYLMRTTPGISDTLQQVDNSIQTEFIPAITGGMKKQPPEVFYKKSNS